FDFISGFGLIDADSAMRTFAAPRPHSIRLVVPTSTPITIPGNDSFLLKVTGENFSTNSEIWYDTTKLETIYISPTRDTIWAYIPSFTGNPQIRVYTAPKTQYNDGGFSNSLYFFDADIRIKAADTTIKYGQQLPTPATLKTEITINGKPLQDTTLALADLGLDHLKFTITAAANSNVGGYSIIPAFDPDHLPNDSLLIKYNYDFIEGDLNIAKMPLKVTPRDTTVTYGQHWNVSFNYEFDPAYPPANAGALTNELKAYHETFLPNNALAVIKDFSKAQADGSHLAESDLANMNMIATFKAVKNSRRFKLDNNNRLVSTTDLNTLNTQYLVDVASESIFNYKKDPSKAKFFSVYPGINSKALLGAAALNNNTTQVETPIGNVSMINGTLAQMVNTQSGPLVPI
ncbi:MAG: hypothetical protein JJE22_05585, partial [Bacteroidia bacterium]|nr:hypothetical protein [Bacteroidia bacterium]